MKIILGSRQSGKTWRMVMDSHKQGLQIVCKDIHQVNYIKDLARTLGATIKDPITTDQLLAQRLRGTHESICIDDADDFIETIARHFGAKSVEAISIGDHRMTEVDRPNG